MGQGQYHAPFRLPSGVDDAKTRPWCVGRERELPVPTTPWSEPEALASRCESSNGQIMTIVTVVPLLSPLSFYLFIPLPLLVTSDRPDLKRPTCLHLISPNEPSKV